MHVIYLVRWARKYHTGCKYHTDQSHHL